MNYDNHFCFQWKSSEQMFSIILIYDNLPTKSSTGTLYCMLAFIFSSPLKRRLEMSFHITNQGLLHVIQT